MYFKTFSTSHIKVYFGFGGFLLKTPLIKLHTEMCCPTGFSSNRLRQAEIADLWEVMVEYSYLFSNKCPENLVQSLYCM